MGQIKSEQKPKKYNKYQIVDIDTGEILKNINNKEYITIATERHYEHKTETRTGFTGCGIYIIATTTRIVKHNGQTNLEL